ncbi:MAG: molybdenum cofactor guanylyltransferase [Thermoanaerobaculia bacterium]
MGSMAGDGAAGAVLAGGASSRMGRDKAALVVEGRSLARRAADTLAAVCSEVVLADRGRGVVPGVRSVPDGAGRGPAAGILGAARALPGRPLLVLGCDLPGVPGPLLRELARRRAADLTLPRGPRGPEPLAAHYGRRALRALEEQVGGGELALRALLERDDLSVEILQGEELLRFGDPEAMFANVNTPEDLASFLRTVDGV